MSDVPERLRAAVIARAHAGCELAYPGVCRRRYENLAHRLPRRFGVHRPANLLAACGSGTTGCHGWSTAHPEVSYERGWMLRDGDVPEAVPARIAPAHLWLAWWLLDSDHPSPGYRWAGDGDEVRVGEHRGAVVAWPVP